MKKGIPPLVIANWKMNPLSVALSTRLITQFKKTLGKIDDVDVVIAPPYVYIDAVAKVRGTTKNLLLGAQNIHHEKMGTHTGEISLPMLEEFGVSHVILGHSERRAEGERDEVINKKLCATVKAGLVGVVCVGELKRDQRAHYLTDIELQVRNALKKISPKNLDQVVIAYEPIWALSTGDGHGQTATTDDVHEMKLFIEKTISDLYGRNLAQKVRIIYGGSVNGKNAHELFTLGTIDGFLVGGASLRADEFVQIVKSVRDI